MQIRKIVVYKFQRAIHSLFVVTMLLAILAWSSTAVAQVLYGTLTGTVTDASGATVPGAHVEALEVSKGLARQASTDSAGIYQFTDLLPGTYKITVSAPSFASQVTGDLLIDGNTVLRLDAKLMVATVGQSVTVNAAPAQLQTDRADVRVEISTEQLDALPSVSSEGKNFQELLRIIPGAGLPSENNSAAANPSRGMTANVNGQSSQGNSTRIDGVLDLDPWLPNNTAYVPPTTAIETVNLATSSFDAEQGNVNGAAVNVQMKSGTNRVHGEAHEFHTDDGLKNRNYFNPPGYRRPLNVFNQFGGSVGGPIIKNKLFFFGAYEGTRQVQSPSGGNPQTVPAGGLLYAAAKSQGFFDFRGLNTDSHGNAVHIYDPRTGASNGANRTPISCNGVVDTLCLSAVDPAALILASMTPAPNQPGTTNNYLDLQKGFYHRDDYDTKINYVPTDRSQFFGHYSVSRGSIYDPPALGAVGGGATNGGQPGYSTPNIYLLGLGATHTFTPNLLLDANIGYTRQHISATDVDITVDKEFGLNTLKIPGTNDAGLASNQLYWGIPEFEYGTAYSALGNSTGSNPFIFRDNQISGNVNLTWVKNKHQFRFGFEDNHTGLNHFQPQGSGCQTARGCFDYTGVSTEQVTCAGSTCSATDPPKTLQFNDYADFLLGLSDQTGKAVIINNPIALRWSQFAGYARDQWQVTPTLSLDYGLRYEAYPMAYSDHGTGTRVLNTATMNVLIGGHGTVPVNDGVNTGHGEFLPRFGLAWRPVPNTVVRVGFGLGADSNNWRFMRNDYPADVLTAWSGTTTGGLVNYNQFAPADSLTGANGANYAAGPYTQLPTGLVLAAAPNVSTGIVPLPKGISTTTIPLNFRRGYIESYNVTVEREFAGFVADVGYVGAGGVRPVSDWNANWAPPGGGNAGRLLNAQFGGNWPDISEIGPYGRSYYDSLQTKITRRFGRSSSLGVVYTWSKTIDYDDNEENGALMWSDPAIIQRNRGLAGFDRTNNFETYWVYGLPFGKGEKWATSGIPSIIAGGWQFSGVLSAMSGTPFTVIDSGNTGTLNGPDEQAVPNIISPIQITNGKPYQNPSSCTTTSCLYFNPASFQRVTAAGVLGDAGRNIIRGPGYFDLDASLHRSFKLTERFTFQVEASAFGLTNTPHFGNPTSDLNSSNFGKVSSTISVSNASLGGSGGEREFFFGGKLIF